MNPRRIFILLTIVCAAAAAAVTPLARLQQRADRFFDQKEWAQASATYYQMLDQRPDSVPLYGKAIVACAMRGDTLAEIQLMNRALDHKIPFDSLLSRVKSTSFQLGNSNLYGDFLLRVKNAHPWLRRPVDAYLLRYYTYRRDGARMIEYANTMLRGDSLNIGFLSTLADGHMLCGEFDSAVDTYRRILAADPDNVNALLQLGCYYYELGDNAAAIPWLRRARRLRPTPHLDAILSRIDPSAAGHGRHHR